MKSNDFCREGAGLAEIGCTVGICTGRQPFATHQRHLMQARSRCCDLEPVHDQISLHLKIDPISWEPGQAKISTAAGDDTISLQQPIEPPHERWSPHLKKEKPARTRTTTRPAKDPRLVYHIWQRAISPGTTPIVTALFDCVDTGRIC